MLLVFYVIFSFYGMFNAYVLLFKFSYKVYYPYQSDIILIPAGHVSLIPLILFPYGI